MSDAPWIAFYASDFLAGTFDLAADERGVYITILSLMWDKGGPIADDASWLARRSGCSTRRFNQIRAALIDSGKIEARGGQLANPRALQDIEARAKKSRQAKSAALARWHGDASPELDLDQPEGPSGTRARAHESPAVLGKKPRKKRDSSQEQNDLISGKNQAKRQNSANSGNADASPLRARANIQNHIQNTLPNDPLSDSCARTREGADRSIDISASSGETSGDSSQTASPPHRPDGQERPVTQRTDDERWNDRRDLVGLMNLCTEATGYAPIYPDEIARQLDIIKAWRDAGIDFDQTILPIMRATVAASSDPTSSFKRFDRTVRHRHAQLAASKVNGGKPLPIPEAPLLTFEGEPPEAKSIRSELLKRMGPIKYSNVCHAMRLASSDAADGRRILTIRQIRPFPLFLDDDRPPLIKAIARAHGFDDVW